MKKWIFLTVIGCIVASFSYATNAQPTADYAQENYTKRSAYIPMRDGVKLYTIIYEPKDTSQTYPMLMKRTCYSVRPYGENEFPSVLGPSKHMMEAGYIFVYQDVRGRYMSEGTFDNMRPHIKGNNLKDKKAIDESSDTYDTIEWLLQNVKNHNGKVGQYGISYPGFYTAAALPEAHPALVASSPQAPIGDFFFDDFHHMGAFTQGYTLAYPVFGHQKEGPQQAAWYRDVMNRPFPKAGNRNDIYDFYYQIGPLKNMQDVYYDDFFLATDGRSS